MPQPESRDNKGRAFIININMLEKNLQFGIKIVSFFLLCYNAGMERKKTRKNVFCKSVTGIALGAFLTGCNAFSSQPDVQGNLLSSPMLNEYFYDELEPYKKEAGEVYNHKNKLWWHTFASGDLNNLQRIALKENFDILKAYARMKQYAAAAQISESSLFPLVDIGFSGGSGSSEKKADSSSQSVSSSSEKYRLNGSASYELDLWGRVRSAYNADKMRFLASRDDWQSAAMTISANVASTWAELLGNQAETDIVKEQINVNESLVKLQKVRFSNSLVSSLDVLQQEEVLASSKSDLPDLLQKNLELKNTLCVLLGKIPGNLPEFSENARLPIVLSIPDVGIPIELLQYRPDIRSAWANVQACHFDLREAEANRFPKINLSVSHVFDASGLSLLLANWTNELLASISYTVFDAGAKKYQVERMRALAEEAIINYTQVVAEAVGEVNNAIAQEYSQHEKLRLLEQQYVMAKSATRGALNAYLEGSEDIMRFLTLLQSTQELERNIAKQRVNVVQVRINLYRSLGNMYFPEDQLTVLSQKESLNEE